jgi:hypothetical protein
MDDRRDRPRGQRPTQDYAAEYGGKPLDEKK